LDAPRCARRLGDTPFRGSIFLLRDQLLHRRFLQSLGMLMERSLEFGKNTFTLIIMADNNSESTQSAYPIF
jgi:hypothetical protein